jgi:hypothetical protein
VAAEAQRRGLDRARAKGDICDGQRYNWAIFAVQFVAWGFVPILDFLHLLGYLYGAASSTQTRTIPPWPDLPSGPCRRCDLNRPG